MNLRRRRVIVRVGFDKTLETVCLVFTLFRHFTSSAFLISINVSGEDDGALLLLWVYDASYASDRIQSQLSNVSLS